MCFLSNSATAWPLLPAVQHKVSLWSSYREHAFSFSGELSDADVERVVSVMNDARGMSPVCAEVFISSY